MAATIRTTCRACGTVEVAVPAAQLQLATQGDDPHNTLRFACPRCGDVGSQRVGERATRLLGRAGIVLVTPAVGAVPATGATAAEGSSLG